MRTVISCLALIGFASSALAAEPSYPTWRGPEVYEPGTPFNYRWAGLYAGAQIGYGINATDFSSSTQSMIAHIVRGLTLENQAHISQDPALGTATTSDKNYGIFVGYNFQWERAVLGIEANYNRTNLPTDASDSIARSYTTTDSVTYNYWITSSASAKITDFGSVRARFGYAWGRVMPYGTFGVAVGRADVFRTATIRIVATNADGTSAGTLGPTTSTEAKTSYIYGISAGLGVDVMLMPHVFVRGEYEYTQFATFSDMTANINTFRVGAGVRF